MTLERAAAALALGGTILVVGHDRTNPTEGVGGPRDPGLLFTPEDIVAELAGLRIVRAEPVHRSVQRDGTAAQAIDALVRAVKGPGAG